MPQKLNDFDFNRNRGREKKSYPDELFDGSIYRLQRGVDFEEKLKVATVISSLRRQAKDMGKTMRTASEGDDAIIIRAENKTTKKGANNGR
jgi:hypothetical protein